MRETNNHYYSVITTHYKYNIIFPNFNFYLLGMLLELLKMVTLGFFYKYNLTITIET